MKGLTSRYWPKREGEHQRNRGKTPYIRDLTDIMNELESISAADTDRQVLRVP